MQRAGSARAFLVIVLLFGAAGLGHSNEVSGKPAKIAVTGESLAGIGQGLMVRVNLLDPENRPAPANKNFEVKVEGRSETGVTEKSKAVVKAGETGTAIVLPVKFTGLVELKASNPELAEGGTIANISAANTQEQPTGGQQATGATTPPTATAGPSATQTPNPPQKSGSSQAIREPALINPLRVAPIATATPTWNPIRMAREPALISPLRVAPIASASPSWNPIIKLRYYPKRNLRADKNDPATISAALPSNDPARDDMLIYLMSDIGPLEPEFIKIPKGGREGKATLVADRPASVQVWYEYSTPAATSADPPLTIKFSHPVWSMKIVPNAPRVSLFESTEVAVQLVDYKGTSVPADEKREVHLRMGSGSGELKTTALAFDPDGSQVVTKFTPKWPGTVLLVASSPYLQEVSGEFTVATPYWLLLLCAVGGLAGAFVAFWTEKPAASWQRIPIGVITGFVLYWALLFGVIHIPNFPHEYVLNPLSAAILSLFGGWGGTKVITLALKQAGLQW
jgi:hypothetical protein